MKLEEVLQAYRKGNTIVSERGRRFNQTLWNKMSIVSSATENEILGEWEIIKVKIKKYPSIIRVNAEFYVNSNYFRSEEEARDYYQKFDGVEFVRLMTEVPELIIEEE